MDHRIIIHVAVRMTLSFAVAIALIPANHALAQSSSSAVTGTVSDPSGAKVSRAEVVLRDVATNVERATVSNGAGDYNFVNVPPASYTLTVSASSFQTETISPFDVLVAQAVNIDVTLKPGSVTARVTVAASGTQVETTTSQLGTVIGTKEVNDVPLNGRNFTQLLELTPGATPISTAQNAPSSLPNAEGQTTASNTNTQFMFPAVNGQGNRETNFLVDGINNNDSSENTYSVPPIIDTVQEFKIVSDADAAYGQALGGVVNVVTKSGTNTLHGTAWEFVRNNDFDAQTYFPSASALYHQNQFGAQVGGPVVIPHLYNGHDKTFFELGYEGFHFSQASQSYFLQPTAAQLGESTWGGAQNLIEPGATVPSGDFSSATTGVTKNGSCNYGSLSTGNCQLYDPTGNHNASSDRPAYVGNQIPVREMDPYALAYINAIFSAPIVIPGISPTTDNGELSGSILQTTYNYSGRIDQHIGTRDFLYARFSDWQAVNSGPVNMPHLFIGTHLFAQQYGVSWLHIFNPTLTMQTQYGKNRVEYNVASYFDISNIASIYGVSSSYSGTYIGGGTIMPNISVTGAFVGKNAISTDPDYDDTHEWLGSVTKIIGRHTIQAGGGWDRIVFNGVVRQGTFSFTGQATANFSGNLGSTVATGQSSQSGLGLADFLLDEPFAATKVNTYAYERPGGIGSIYLQDSWRITSNLTMNYGLRYDRTVMPQYGTDGTIGEQGSIETGDWDLRTGTYILQVAPPTCAARGHAPCLPSATLPANVRVALDQKILHGSKTNFGPRLGLAYRVNDKLALRGGFGIVFGNWAGITQMSQDFHGSWPDIGTLTATNLNTPGSAAYTSGQNPFGNAAATLPAASPDSVSNMSVDPEWKDPYSEQWNVGLEQQFGQHNVASINYVGSATHRLDIGSYYNTGTLSTTPFATRQKEYAANPTVNYTGQPFPYVVPINYDFSAGNGNYNALQTAFTRRTSNGLTFNAAYTWSKAIDPGTDGWFGEGGTPEDPYNWRGSRSVAGYNIPQLVTLGLVYAVPVGKNTSYSTGNRVADYILGNWELGTIFVGRSGQNFTVSSGGDIGNTGNSGTYERANLTGNPHISNPSKAEWFNTAAFTTPASGTLGNSGRNILEQQRYIDLDGSVFRIFPIRESLNFQLRIDAFNSLNHPVLGTPGNTTTSSGFGQITSVANNTNQRLLQFSGKIQF